MELWLGDMDHRPTYTYRRSLLEKALGGASSVVIRDGANNGLAFMDDPHAIPVLKKAIKGARCAVLRQALEQTLAQLERTKKCLDS